MIMILIILLLLSYIHIASGVCNQCINEGHYCDGDSCLACPAGYYCPSSNTNSKTACPAGTTSLYWSMSLADCTPITGATPTGYYNIINSYNIIIHNLYQ